MAIEKGRKRDTWNITFNLPWKDENGKYIRAPKKTVHGKKSEAKEALARYKIEYLAQIRGGKESRKAAHKDTVGSYAQKYHESKAMDSPLAKKREGLEIRHIQRLFGDIPLKELDAKTVRKIYAEERRRRDSGEILEGSWNYLSEDGLHKVHVKLRQILKQAYMDEDIDKNPCDLIEFPDPPQTEERKPLDPEDARRFREETITEYKAAPDAKLVAILIAMSTGLRRGELLGLNWGDVDFENRTVNIQRQYSTDKGLRDPKAKSKRILAIDNTLLAILKDWKDVQASNIPRTNELRRAKGLAAVSQDDDYPIVTGQRYGNRHDPDTFDRFFRNYSVDHGFGRFTKDVVTKTYGGRTFTRGKGYEGLKLHELRHTVASLLIADGLDVKSAQRQMGHSSAQTTLNIYAHAFESRSRDASDRLERIYG